MQQSSETRNIQHTPIRQSSKRTWSVIFLIIASLFVSNGLFTLSSDSRVVGGDAYNYIISAGRGTGVICAGIFFALVSVVIAILDLTDEQKRIFQHTESYLNRMQVTIASHHQELLQVLEVVGKELMYEKPLLDKNVNCGKEL